METARLRRELDERGVAVLPPPSSATRRLARLAGWLRSDGASSEVAEPTTAEEWQAAVLEAEAGDVASILAREPDPFRAMADMRTPGVIIRKAYPPADIPRLVQRLIDRRLMRGPDDPVELTADGSFSDVVRDEAGRVFKGSSYVRPEANGRGPRPGMGGWTPSRIDIGTSFGGGWGNVGADGDASAKNSGGMSAFFAHSAGTHELFSTLFEGMPDPVEILYDCCAQLTNAQQTVMVAEEPDGRQYGPAIFRVHYEGHDYQPHINHVGQTERARELHNLTPKAESTPDYNAFRFAHQMAALICVQHTSVQAGATAGSTLNGTATSATPQAIVHRVRPNADTAAALAAGEFGSYLHQAAVPSATLHVEPGDFYIFNAGLLHEVPIIPVGGDARIVLATFIGYSEDDPEIHVWA